MAGHSHWAGIKHKKKLVDAKRGKLFSKLAKKIIVAARHGGGDPSGNSSLALAIEKAKAANTEFVHTFEEFLRSVWVGIVNINTTSGLDPHTKERGGTESRTRLWSTTKDSVFARHGQIDAGAPLLRIEFEVRETTDKPRVVWVARAESATRRADRYRYFNK